MNYTDFYYLKELSQPAIKKAIDKFVKQDNNEDEVTTIVNQFNDLATKNKIKKVDIFALSFDELKKVVKDASSQKSRKEKSNIIKDKETEYVFENDKVLVVSPLSHQSSCKYGSGTKWCTTQRDDKYWNKYYSEGVKLYYIIPKDDSKDDKVAVAVYPDRNSRNPYKTNMEIFNVWDDSMDQSFLKGVITTYNIPENIFKPISPEELQERDPITEKDWEHIAERILKDIDYDEDDYDQQLKDTVELLKEKYQEYWDEYGGEERTSETFRYNMEQATKDFYYYIETALEYLEKRYGIDPVSSHNKVLLIPDVITDDRDLLDIIENEEGPFSKERIKDFGWDYNESKNINQFLEDEDIDWDDTEGLEQDIQQKLEKWLTHKYNDNFKEFETFIKDVLEIAKNDLKSQYGNRKISDKVKEQLKDIHDKVKKVQYGKQDHPKLDLNNFQHYLLRRL